MKNLLLLLFSVVLSGALMAQTPTVITGYETEGNEAYIEQVGAFGTMQGKNDAFIDQTGAEDAKAYISQNGYNNEAYIGQKGKGNVAGGGVWDHMSLCCPHLEFGASQIVMNYRFTIDVRDIQLLCKDVETPSVFVPLPWVGYGIVQLGMYNSASIKQCGDYNHAGIRQEGAGLNAQICQTGDENVGLIWMKTEGLFTEGNVVQVQKGESSFAYTALKTKGMFNTSEALIMQDNTKHNIAIQLAEGSSLKLGISQNSEFGSCSYTGEDNVAVQLVEGRCLEAYIEQRGDDNKAIELVAGKDNWAGISQWGDNNHAMIKQGDPIGVVIPPL